MTLPPLPVAPASIETAAQARAAIVASQASDVVGLALLLAALRS